jgi:hypothetical protein
MNDLNDRLRQLGDHIDAERAANDTGSSTATGHPTRFWALAAAAVLVIAGIVGITVWRSNRQDDVSAPITPPPTSVAPPTSVTSTTSADGGKIVNATFFFHLDGSPPASGIETTIFEMNQRLQDMLVQGAATATSSQGEQVRVDVSGIRRDDMDTLARWLAAVSSTIHFRPVLEPCATGIHNDLAHWPPLQTDTATLHVAGRDDGFTCTVGPAQVNESVFRTGVKYQYQTPSTPKRQWTVIADLVPGSAGADVFNALASACYQRDTSCPTGQMAVEVGGVLLSVSSVMSPTFSGELPITGESSRLDAYGLGAAITRQVVTPYPVVLRSQRTTP